LELAQTHLQTRLAQCQAPHDKALRRAQRKYKRQRVENKRRRDLDLRHAWRTYRRKLAQLQQRGDHHRQTLDENHQRRVKENQELYQRDLGLVHEKGQTNFHAIQEARDTSQQQLAGAWTEGLARIQTAVDQLGQVNDQLFPPWTEDAWR